MPTDAPSDDQLPPTARTELRRAPERGSFDRSVIDAILDEAVHCHLGFVDDGQPFVLPTVHARVGDILYVHGSAASRMLRHLGRGVPMCCTVTLLDGLVVARTAFHHSINYRGVVVLGTGQLVTDIDAKRAALDAIVDHVVPGRSAEVRPHTDTEVAATKVLELPITEASAKVRTGDPRDDAEDLDGDVWAGVIDRRDVWRAPQPSGDLRPGIEIPPSVIAYGRPAPDR